MSLMGMDIEAVQGLLGRLEGGAITELGNVLSGLNGTVQELRGVWQGLDADTFQAAWSQQHQVNLTNLHLALTDLGGSMARAITDQRNVSGH